MITTTKRLPGRGAVLVNLLAVMLATEGCAGKPAPPPAKPTPVGVQVVSVQPVTQSTELPGRTSPLLSSDVRPQINGIIKARLFTEGAAVKAGQVLYQIDPAPYQAILDQAKGVLANAEASLTTAKSKAQRYADLVKINAVARQDNDDAQAAYQQAAATVVSDKAAVESAQINLGYTRITAPISGRIGRSLYTPGALVTSGQSASLATIQNFDPIYVDLNQSSDELVALKRQLSAGALSNSGLARVKLIMAGGITYPHEGELKFSEVTVDQTTDSVVLRAVFPNPDGVLLPGMFVHAVLVQGVLKNGILAPQTAIAHDPKGDATAMVVNAQNQAESRPVKIGDAFGPNWLVTSGLQPGDRLIIRNSSKVHAGQTVTVTTSSPPPPLSSSDAQSSGLAEGAAR